MLLRFISECNLVSLMALWTFVHQTFDIAGLLFEFEIFFCDIIIVFFLIKYCPLYLMTINLLILSKLNAKSNDCWRLSKCY